MLNEQIIKTLEYFDVQDHPLTLLEIHKYLLGRQSDTVIPPSEILSTIEAMPDKVRSEHGLYFLSGREHLPKRRLENNFYSTERLKRAKKYLPGARFVPFVSALAIAGSEAASNSKQGSDIDLLVLTKPNRIWLARLFLTAYFQFFGIRRHGAYIENRFCLNHYLQEGRTVGSEKHLYTAIEYVSLIPYFGADKIYEFQKNNLEWMKNYLAQPQLIQYQPDRKPQIKKICEALLNKFIGDFLEKKAGQLQRRRIKIQDSIVIENEELSFHPGNKGRQVLEKLV
jgi:predicted nucleotidyltransferase